MRRVTFRVEELHNGEYYKRFGNCVRRLTCKQSNSRILNTHSEISRWSLKPSVILCTLLHYSPYVHIYYILM